MEDENIKKQMKILFIDDNYDFFTSINPLLEKKFITTYAGDGFTAFQLVQKNKFDAILCDINMPMLNGFNLLSEFKKKNISIPFLFISGVMDEKIVSLALQAGAYNVMQKPFEIKDLVLKLNSAIELHKQELVHELSDQDRAYIYNTLKSYYYDVDRLIRMIQNLNLSPKQILEELDKKAMSGKCIFDDIYTLKHYKSA